MRRIVIYVASILVAAALVAGAALAPMLWFNAEDRALFGETHPYPVNTGTLHSAAYELAAVKALYNYEQIESGEYNTTSSQSQQELDELLPRSYGYIERLCDAGMLPAALRDWLAQNLYASDSINFSRIFDSRGFEYLTTNFGMGVDPPYYVSMTIDMASDLVILFDAHLPIESPLPEYDYTKALAVWRAYLGLDVVDNWSDIVGNLYSDELGANFNLDEVEQYALAGIVPNYMTAYQYCDDIRVTLNTSQSRYADTSGNSLNFSAYSYRRGGQPYF